MTDMRKHRPVTFAASPSQTTLDSSEESFETEDEEPAEMQTFFPNDDDDDEPPELPEEDDNLCGHPGCSFVYNVHESCLHRPSFVMESVPYMTYLKLAPILDMDPYKKMRQDGSNRCKVGSLMEEDEEVNELIRLVEKEMGLRSDLSMDAQVEVGTLRNSIHEDPRVVGVPEENPYLKRLKKEKTNRGAEEMRNSLGRRSKQITQMIIKDFLAWYRSVGVEDEETTVDETILQDLFQIGFDAPTARAVALRIKEMPVVPESLAQITDSPEFAVKKGLNKLIKMDIQLEMQPPRLFAFGNMLPKEKPCLRFQPPKNNIKRTWTECERVPAELESLKLVWEGIENLRSTIAFCNWMKKQPDITPPGYLIEKGLLNINYEEWMQIFKGFEKDIDVGGQELDSRSGNNVALRDVLYV